MNIQLQKSFIFMTVAVLLLLASFYYLLDVWLIIFGAVLTAVFLLSLMEYLKKIPKVGVYFAKMPHGWLLALVVIVLLAIFSGFGAMFGHELVNQFEDLKQMTPKAIDTIDGYLKGYPTFYEWLMNQRFMMEIKSDPQAYFAKFSEGAIGQLTGFLGGMLSAVGTFVIIMILGLFIAISPSVYRRSFVALVPPDSRDKAEYLLERSYRAMQQWLVAQLVVMAFVGISTTIALWLMGIPFALAMGFIAFLLDFIPVLGPWLSAVPIMVLTLIVAPKMLVWVALMIVVVQQLESYVVAPIIQKHMVDLPPVALLLSQVIMGSVTGILGIALAAPLMVVAIVWVQVVYIKFTLGDYGVRVLDQNEAQMRADPYGDFERYKRKQAIENRPSLKKLLKEYRQRKEGLFMEQKNKKLPD